MELWLVFSSYGLWKQGDIFFPCLFLQELFAYGYPFNSLLDVICNSKQYPIYIDLAVCIRFEM